MAKNLGRKVLGALWRTGEGADAQPPDQEEAKPEAQLPPGTAKPEALGRLRGLAAAVLKDSAYQKFIDVVETLSELAADKTARYKTAVKVVAKQGVELKDILATFLEQRRELNQEKASFEARITERMAKDVDSKTTQIADLDVQVQMAREALAKLEEQAANLKASTAATKAQLEQAAADFHAALTMVSDEIDANETEFKSLVGA